MSQREVAEIVGISQVYLNHIEHGTRNIGLTLSLNICKVLDLNFNDFIVSLTMKKPTIVRPK